MFHLLIIIYIYIIKYLYIIIFIYIFFLKKFGLYIPASFFFSLFVISTLDTIIKIIFTNYLASYVF